jgi:hypothetical protein
MLTKGFPLRSHNGPDADTELFFLSSANLLYGFCSDPAKRFANARHRSVVPQAVVEQEADKRGDQTVSRKLPAELCEVCTARLFRPMARPSH